MFKKITLTSAIAVGTTQAGLLGLFDSAETRKADVLWWINGIQGFNTGFHQSLYAVPADGECMSSDTPV